MKRTVIMMVILAAMMLAIGTVSADTGYPRNGNFESGANYWQVAGDVYITSGEGYASSVGLKVYTNGIAQSETLALGGPWDLQFVFKTVGSVGQVRVSLFNPGNNSEVLITEQSPANANAWTSVVVQSLNHAGNYALRFRNPGSAAVVLDSISTEGNVSVPAPTPTPTGAPTATPAVTPTYGANSGSGAAARITVAATSVYADSGSVSSTMALPISGTVVSGHLANVVITVGEWGLCFPTEISQVFTDVPMCMTIPVYHVKELWLAGVDMIPGFTGLVAILLFVFIVRQLQER